MQSRHSFSIKLSKGLTFWLGLAPDN